MAGLIGTLVRQFPAFTLHDPQAYAAELVEMHRRWDPIAPFGLPLGPALVEAFDRLGFFRVFSAPWFLVLVTVLTVSIVCCTLDRAPRLWRQVRAVRVEQAEAFFDLRLEHRAELSDPAPEPPVMRAALRSQRYRVREATSADGAVSWLYGDRNQYGKLATLLTHAGLVLFLVGGAVTVALGFETVLFVGEGQTAPVQPVGTPDNLLVKNIDFEAPRRADGSFADFRTDLAVYQNGEPLARKTIRVNDPLETGGFFFHQNTFGPSADLTITDPGGRLLWTGPVLLAGELLGLPQGFLTIPGSPVGLLVLLDREADGVARLVLQGIGPPDESGQSTTLFLARLGLGATSDPSATGGFAITWDRAGAWTGLIVRRDPGQPLIWIAFALLISGLVLTFYFPRRRVWVRLAAGRAQLALVGDRYVDVPRELARLLAEVTRHSSDSPPDRPRNGSRA